MVRGRPVSPQCYLQSGETRDSVSYIHTGPGKYPCPVTRAPRMTWTNRITDGGGSGETFPANRRTLSYGTCASFMDWRCWACCGNSAWWICALADAGTQAGARPFEGSCNSVCLSRDVVIQVEESHGDQAPSEASQGHALRGAQHDPVALVHVDDSASCAFV